MCNQNKVDCARLSTVIKNCTTTGDTCVIKTNGGLDIFQKIHTESCTSDDNSNQQQQQQTNTQTNQTGNQTTNNTGGNQPPNTRRKRQVSTPFIMFQVSFNHIDPIKVLSSDPNQPQSGGDKPPKISDMGAVPEVVDSEYKFLLDYTALLEEDRALIGHQFSDFVKSCTFR